jgi:hypothetical protein
MLTNVVSDVRSGKTLWTTAVAVNEVVYAQRFNLPPRPVLANYKIRLPNWKPLRPELLFTITKPTLVLLDEAYAWLESRQSGTPISRYMSYILFQSGKRGIDFYLTDQIEGSIDTRYRQLLNYRVECENLGVNTGFLYHFTKRVKGGFTMPSNKIMPYSWAEKIFPYYDTLEIVNPIDEELLYKVSQNKENTVERITTIVQKMLLKFPPNAWKIPMIENYCLKEKIPHYMVKMIHGEIKTKIAENIYNSTYTKRLKRRETHD